MWSIMDVLTDRFFFGNTWIWGADSIPVIGKADTLTEEELTGFKARVITL